MTPEEILADFSSQDAFPSEAMAAAGANRDAMIPVFLDQIDRLLSDEPGSFNDADVSAFLFVYFLLGEWRDARAYRPLAALLRQDPDFVDMLIGDAVTEGTARVIAGVCDGDLQPIFTVIEDSAADEFVRGQMIDALVIIADTRPDKLPEVEAFFDHFPEADFEKPDVLWESWAFAAADLGLAHLEPIVREAYENQRISPLSSNFDHFKRALKDALETGRSHWFHNSRDTRLIESAAEELSRWYSFSEKARESEARQRDAVNDLSLFLHDTFERAEPKVGRNDPCPCGSGRKFKKCCLQ